MISSLRSSTLFCVVIGILAWVNVVKADNLFIGCGDGLNEVEMTFTTPSKDVCYNTCKSHSYTYYTHQPGNVCVCYIYPPPAAEYMPGGPNGCNGQMQYNLIKSSWNFLRCYNSPPSGLTEIPSDSFKACLDKCKPNEIAIARPTGIYPGQTNCICTTQAKLNGLKEVKCDYQKYYAYSHKPNTKRAAQRDSRPNAIAQRHVGGSEEIEEVWT